MSSYQLNRLDSIGSLRQNFDTTSSLQQILQLLPGQRFIIDDKSSQGHNLSNSPVGR